MTWVRVLLNCVLLCVPRMVRGGSNYAKLLRNQKRDGGLYKTTDNALVSTLPMRGRFPLESQIESNDKRDKLYFKDVASLCPPAPLSGLSLSTPMRLRFDKFTRLGLSFLTKITSILTHITNPFLNVIRGDYEISNSWK